MKILIINYFAQNASEKVKFAKFEALVKQFAQEQRQPLDNDIEFIIKDCLSIKEILFEFNTKYDDIKAAQLFNTIDIICIDGSQNLLPWAKPARKLCLLIRMCLQSQKKLFLSSCAMHALVYLLSTGFNKDIDIINGSKGTSINEFNQFSINTSQINSETDFLLDNASGDLYNFISGQWVPSNNTGLHLSSESQKFQQIGQFILQAPKFKPKLSNEQALLEGKDAVIQCIIKQKYLNHWLFNNCETQFTVSKQNKWEIHRFQPNKQYNDCIILADSLFGPQIIQGNQYTICTQFNVDLKCPQSLIILKNFITKMINEVRQEHNSIPIEIAKDSLKHTIEDPFSLASYKQQAKEKLYLKKDISVKIHQENNKLKQNKIIYCGLQLQAVDNQTIDQQIKNNISYNNIYNKINTIMKPQQLSFIDNQKQTIANNKFLESIKQQQQNPFKFLSQKILVNNVPNNIHQVPIKSRHYTNLSTINNQDFDHEKKVQNILQQSYDSSLNNSLKNSQIKIMSNQQDKFIPYDKRVFLYPGVNNDKLGQNNIADQLISQRQLEAHNKITQRMRKMTLIFNKPTYNVKIIELQNSQFQNNVEKNLQQNYCIDLMNRSIRQGKQQMLRPRFNHNQNQSLDDDQIEKHINQVDFNFRDITPEKWIGKNWRFT